MTRNVLISAVLLICTFISTASHPRYNIATVEACRGDIDQNGKVDIADLEIIKNTFDYSEQDIFDVVPQAYSYGEQCRWDVFLPIIIRK